MASTPKTPNWKCHQAEGSSPRGRKDTSGGCIKAIAESELPSGTNPGHAADFHFKMKKALRQRNGHCYLLRKSLEQRKSVKL